MRLFFYINGKIKKTYLKYTKPERQNVYGSAMA